MELTLHGAPYQKMNIKISVGILFGRMKTQK